MTKRLRTTDLEDSLDFLSAIKKEKLERGSKHLEMLLHFTNICLKRLRKVNFSKIWQCLNKEL